MSKLAIDGRVLVSREGIQILKVRLAEIKEEMKAKTLEMGEIARADFDLPENRHFKNLRFEVMYGYPRKIEEVANQIRKATHIEDTLEYQNLEPGVVWAGCQVVIRYLPEEETETWTILGPAESDINRNIISYESPLAAALIGSRCGDRISFRESTIEILQTQKILE